MSLSFRSPGVRATLGLCIGLGVGVLTGVVVLGDPWQEAVVPAVGTAIGLAVVFYFLPRDATDTDRTGT
jgi:hypothetical protein